MASFCYRHGGHAQTSQNASLLPYNALEMLQYLAQVAAKLCDFRGFSAKLSGLHRFWCKMSLVGFPFQRFVNGLPDGRDRGEILF